LNRMATFDFCRRLQISVVAIATVATICRAGYWTFALVDNGSIGSYVTIDKTSDGTIWLAYENRDSVIRLAHADAGWWYEDLDTSLVRPPFSFDIGPGDVMGVVGSGRLAERRDSVWSSEQLPMPMRDAALSYDPAGRPSLTFKDSLWRGCLGLKTDSSWDTNVVYMTDSNTYSLTRPGWRRNGNCALIEADVWTEGGLIDGYDVSLKRRDNGVWTDFGGAGGLDGGGCGFAALADSSDSIHTLWSAGDPYGTDELVCDGVRLDGYTSIGAACLDGSGRVQCVWVGNNALEFDLLHEPIQVVLSGVSITCCDITTDSLSQPVIAYRLSDGSIHVAHGVGVAALSDAPQQSAVSSLSRIPSVVRNVLLLRQSSGRKPQAASLLDAAGRRVAELHIGANDVSRFAPGVYFVGDGGVGHERAGVRRVVVVR